MIYIIVIIAASSALRCFDSRLILSCLMSYRIYPSTFCAYPTLHTHGCMQPGGQRLTKAVDEVENLFWDMIGGPSGDGFTSASWNSLLSRTHIEVVYAAELDTMRFGSAFATGDEVWVGHTMGGDGCTKGLFPFP